MESLWRLFHECIFVVDPSFDVGSINWPSAINTVRTLELDRMRVYV